MDDPLLVRGFERVGDLSRDRQCFVEWNRTSRSGSAANSSGRILIATWRPRDVSVARQTCPIPPSPIGAVTS